MLLLPSLSLEGIDFHGKDTPSIYPTRIQANELYMTKPQMLLQGDVAFDSPIGMLNAQKVRFFPKEHSDFLPTFHAKDQVSTEMHTGATLLCDEAIFHGDLMKGICLSKGDNSRVLYTDPEISDLPFQVSCTKSTIFCQKGSKNGFSIDHIKAWKDVNIFYDQELTAKCDKALIHHASQEQESHLLLLKIPHEGNTCEIKMINGDQLHGNMFSITQDKLFCVAPKGKLFLESSPTPFNIKGQKISWDRNLDELKCKGPVILWHRDFGKLSSRDEITVQRSGNSLLRNGIETITSRGKSLYVYPQGPGGLTSKLTCHHEITFDQNRQIIHLKSNDPEEPVVYEDMLRTIRAKTVILDFDYEQNAFSPKNIFLKGNVTVEVHSGQDPLAPNVLKQYAMADQVDYNILTGSMLLSSTGKKSSVIFVDELNKTTMSAPSVLLSYDQDNKEVASAQGFGNVRFMLDDNEKMTLKKHFPTL